MQFSHVSVFDLISNGDWEELKNCENGELESYLLYLTKVYITTKNHSLFELIQSEREQEIIDYLDMKPNDIFQKSKENQSNEDAQSIYENTNEPSEKMM